MSKLGEKQIQALQYLSLGMTAKDTAKKIGVTPETLSAWNRDYDYRAIRNGMRFDAIEATRDALRWASGKAAETLIELMGPGHPDMVRLRAAAHLLEFTRQDADKVGGYTPQEVKYDEQYEYLRKYPPTVG